VIDQVEPCAAPTAGPSLGSSHQTLADAVQPSARCGQYCGVGGWRYRWWLVHLVLHRFARGVSLGARADPPLRGGLVNLLCGVGAVGTSVFDVLSRAFRNTWLAAMEIGHLPW